MSNDKVQATLGGVVHYQLRGTPNPACGTTAYPQERTSLSKDVTCRPCFEAVWVGPSDRDERWVWKAKFFQEHYGMPVPPAFASGTSFADSMAAMRTALATSPEEMAALGARAKAMFHPETTGEHTRAKLADNPYQHAVDPKDVPPAVAAEAQIPAYGMMQDYAASDVRLTNEMADRLFAELYPQPVPKRSKMLTPSEIRMACGIVVTVILVFLFVVFAYPGW
jgi:hypothetical protein